MRFVFHPEAEAEAAAQRDYYDNKEDGLCRRFSEWMMMHVGLLTANPRAFPVKWKVRHCYMSIFPFDIVFGELDGLLLCINNMHEEDTVRHITALHTATASFQMRFPI